MTTERLVQTKVIVGSAYLICIDINEAEGSRESFKAMLDQAEHSADVKIGRAHV